MRNMRRWPVVLLLAAVLFSCSRADSAPGGTSNGTPEENRTDTVGAGAVYRLEEADVTLTVPASTEVAVEEHNVIRVRIREEEAEEADLTGLEALSSLYQLDIAADGDIGELILPSNAAYTLIEAGTVGYLDASRCRHTRPMELRCRVEDADMNESVESLVVSDDSVFRLRGLTGLRNIAFLHPVDLSPLADTALSGQEKSVLVTRAPDDEPWDLSPLADADITILRLGNTVTEDELNTLAGGRFTTIELSDEGIGDLSFLNNTPQVTSLLLTVSGVQPEEILPFLGPPAKPVPSDLLGALSTSLPAEQLLAFAERGDVYLFFDARR